MSEREPIEASKIRAGDSALLKEMAREAELFLAAQLQAGLAADQRAMRLSGVLSTAVSLLVGGLASLKAAELDLGLHQFVIFVLIAMLIVALALAVSAAKPTKFNYAGSNPRFWIPDIEGKVSLDHALGGQIKQYSEGIEENSDILQCTNDRTRYALNVLFAATVITAFAEFMIFMISLGAGSK
jgi:hypothetical protein